jgi:hypothetical protein
MVVQCLTVQDIWKYVVCVCIDLGYGGTGESKGVQ